jgi:hypothetical protein
VAEKPFIGSKSTPQGDVPRMNDREPSARDVSWRPLPTMRDMVTLARGHATPTPAHFSNRTVEFEIIGRIVWGRPRTP